MPGRTVVPRGLLGTPVYVFDFRFNNCDLKPGHFVGDNERKLVQSLTFVLSWIVSSAKDVFGKQRQSRECCLNTVRRTMGEEKPAAEASAKQAPGEGIRNIRTTNIFRAVNFELYAKPNKVVMLLGVLMFSSCTAYIAYWNVTQKDAGPTYMALQEDGKLTKRLRTSRWD